MQIEEVNILKQVKYIFYLIGGYFEGYESVSLEKYGKDVRVTRSNLSNVMNETKTTSAEFFNKVLSEVSTITQGWKNNYSNPNILDGTQWELLISVYSKKDTDRMLDELNGSAEINGILFYSGSNAYPDNFEQLETYMEGIK